MTDGISGPYNAAKQYQQRQRRQSLHRPSRKSENSNPDDARQISAARAYFGRIVSIITKRGFQPQPHQKASPQADFSSGNAEILAEVDKHKVEPVVDAHHQEELAGDKHIKSAVAPPCRRLALLCLVLGAAPEKIVDI